MVAGQVIISLHEIRGMRETIPGLIWYIPYRIEQYQVLFALDIQQGFTLQLMKFVDLHLNKRKKVNLNIN